MLKISVDSRKRRRLVLDGILASYLTQQLRRRTKRSEIEMFDPVHPSVENEERTVNALCKKRLRRRQERACGERRLLQTG